MENFHLASSLRAVTSKLFKRLRKESRLEEVLSDEEDLNLTELGTLAHLFNRGTLYPSELAELEKVKAQSMSQILNKLEKLQFITKTPSEEDRRKVAISLSAHGRELVEKSRYQRDVWLAGTIGASLTAKQKAILEEAVAILDTLADTK